MVWTKNLAVGLLVEVVADLSRTDMPVVFMPLH